MIEQQSSRPAHGGALALLRRSPLFAGWSEADLSTIAGWLRPLDAPIGAVICRQGEPGGEMYFIETGQVRVTSADGRYVYDYLGPGSFFGEIALLGNQYRTATVAVTMPVRLWVLPKLAFDHMLGARPPLRE